MRLTRLPVEAATALYLLAYLPYILVTRALSTRPNAELGRPLTGLESLPVVLILGTISIALFAWWSGWWRSAHKLQLGGLTIPWPTRWTLLSGFGTALLLFTVPLSLTFEGVSIPFIQLIMRGDVLVIAPLVDLATGRKVRWYSWVALAMVGLAMGMSLWARKGLHLPPLAIFAVIAYTIGYFIRLAVMTRVAKTPDEDTLKGYFVEEKMVAMPLSVLALWLVTISPMARQGSELGWGFADAWTSSAMPLLLVMSVAFFAVSILSALILLNPRENTFCVPLERAASILAGSFAAIILALAFGQPFPTPVEWVGIVLLIGAITLLSVAPHWRRAA